MKVRFKYKDGRKPPFNGEYIHSLKRIPNIGEHISITNHPAPYKVIDVITEIKSYDDFYIIIIE